MFHLSLCHCCIQVFISFLWGNKVHIWDIQWHRSTQTHWKIHAHTDPPAPEFIIIYKLGILVYAVSIYVCIYIYRSWRKNNIMPKTRFHSFVPVRWSSIVLSSYPCLYACVHIVQHEKNSEKGGWIEYAVGSQALLHQQPNPLYAWHLYCRTVPLYKYNTHSRRPAPIFICRRLPWCLCMRCFWMAHITYSTQMHHLKIPFLKKDEKTRIYSYTEIYFP